MDVVPELFMRLAVAILIATLAASTAAQAGSRRQCTRVAGDYVGGPNAWMMWTDDKPGPLGGTTYGDIGLTCSSTHHAHHRWRYSHPHFHRRWWHSDHRLHHAHTAYRGANWV